MLSKSSDEAQSLIQTITELESDMRTKDGDSEEYATCLNRLERLYKLQEKHSPKSRIDLNTLILAGANILGIVIIVAYEHGHPVVSKALSQVGRTR